MGFEPRPPQINLGVESLVPNPNPEDKTKTMATFQKVSSLLRQFDSKFLRVCWCDNANVIRAKAVYSPGLERVFKEGVALVRAAQVHLF